MSLSSISIKRPVLATVFSLLILLFGGIGMTFLGVREFPSVDPPIISVSVSYPGANSDVIESQITEPLEQSINGIPGIRTLTSSSSQGSSRITVEFELSVDLETAQSFAGATLLTPRLRSAYRIKSRCRRQSYLNGSCKKSEAVIARAF